MMRDRRRWNIIRWTSVGVYMLVTFLMVGAMLIFPGYEGALGIAMTVFVFSGLVVLLIVLSLPQVMVRRPIPVPDGSLDIRPGPAIKEFRDQVRMDLVLYLIIPLIAILLLTGAIGFDPAVSAINFVAAAFFAVILSIFWRLSIEADIKEVHFHYGPFGKRLEVHEIATIRPVAVHPLKDYMGWGIRMGPDGSIGYISSGRTGVRIETKGGKAYVVSCNRPQDLVDLVRSARRKVR